LYFVLWFCVSFLFLLLVVRTLHSATRRFMCSRSLESPLLPPPTTWTMRKCWPTRGHGARREAQMGLEAWFSCCETVLAWVSVTVWVGFRGP
jgi:hypothetical protein